MEYYVSGGDSSDSIILHEYDNMYVFSLGTTSDITVDSGSFLYVSNGGVASRTSVLPGGKIDVFNNGTAFQTLISGPSYFYGGSMRVFSGGVASETIVSGGECYANDGGLMDKTSVMNGRLYVSGGTANNTTVFYLGEIHISNGALANNILVSSGAGCYVYATWNDPTVQPVVNSLTMVDSAWCAINGGTVTHVKVKGGTLNVGHGVLDDVDVGEGGAIYASGGTMLNVRENGGWLSFWSNAVVTFAPNSFSGVVLDSMLHSRTAVHSGTTAIEVTINRNCYMDVFSGGTAERTTILGNAGLVAGRLFLSGGTASGTVLSAGSLVLLPGGFANDTLVTGGRIIISGGLVENTLNQGGSIAINSGGTANNTTISLSSTGRLSSVELTINSGGSANDITVKIGTVAVYNGGQASGVAVSSGGYFNIYSGGVTDHIVLHAKGHLTVSSGGTATNILWTPCEGVLEIDDGASYSFTENYSGVFYGKGGQLYSRAMVMNGKTVSSSYEPDEIVRMYVFSGGTANNAEIGYNGEIDIFSGGTANGATVIDGMLQVFSGAVNSTVISSYGKLQLRGGMAVDNIVAGKLGIFSGGTASNTIVTSSGIGIEVFTGGVANDVILEGGGMVVSSGGMADSVTVNSGNLYISAGGTATNILENGGYVSATEDAVVTFLPNSIVGMCLSYNQRATLHSGTIADNTVMSSGTLYVFSSGTATHTTGNSGGITVFSGGIVNDVNIKYGGISLSGGAANDIVFYYGRVNVSGGTVNGVFISSGSIGVSSGIVNDVNLNEGSIYIYRGGTVRDVTTGDYLYLYVSEGGMLTGRIRMETGAVVSMYKGSILDFDLTRTTPGESALVNEFSLISGSPNYTLTVSATQAKGIYMLSEGVNQFDSTITVRNAEGEDIGAISLDSSVELFGNLYTLHLIAGDLLLTVGCEPLQPVVISGTVLSYETGDVNSGEVYYRTAVSNGGVLNVLSGGTAKYASVSSGGSLNVLDGGMTMKNAIYSRGLQAVLSGGTADSTTVYDYGSVYVSDDGTANHTRLGGYGAVFDLDGGTANHTVVRGNAAVFNILSGEANNTFLNGYASICLFSGGAINSTTVDSGGSFCLSGGTAYDTVVYSGSINVCNGGVVNHAEVSSGGAILVSSGGTATDVTIYSFASLWLINGGTANSAIINSNAYAHVSSGCIANATTIESGGSLIVSWYGSANSTTVNPGGRLNISGGTATCIIENGGYVSSATSTNASFMPHTFSGVVLSTYDSVTVHSGTTAYLTTINSGGFLDVYSGGTVNNAIINSGGSLTVSYGITANSTVLNPNGRLNVSSGGTATAIIENGGYVYADQDATVSFLPNTFSGDFSGIYSATVHSGTTASEISLTSGANLDVMGGNADSITVNIGGCLNVSSGGTATEIIENGGYVSLDENANVTFIANTFSGLLIHSQASASLHSGTTAVQTMLDNALLYICSGGTADDVTINNGIVFVSQGGILNDVTVCAYFPSTYYHYYYENNGNISVSSGGIVNNTTMNDGGRFCVSNGGIANNTTLNSGGALKVYSGGTANSATVNFCGYFSVANGGAATDILENGGYVSLDENANVTFIANTLSDIVLSNWNMSASLHSGTVMNGALLISGGSLDVFSGGIANNVSVNFSGYYCVSSGGTANSTMVNDGGSLIVSSGGTATDILENGGYVSLDENANVTFIANTLSDIVLSNWNMSASLHSGTVMNGALLISGGSLDVFSGGIANNTTLNSGGALNVSSGGTVNSTMVNDGGSLIVSSGGTATEIIENGGYVSLDENANVTFLANTFSGQLIYSLATIHSGTTAVQTTIEGGTLHILSGGKAAGITISRGGILVSNGGMLNDVTVNADYVSRGSRYVYSYPISYLQYYEVPNVTVSSGGIVNNTTLNRYGRFHISSGGITNNMVICSGCGLNVYSGGTANGVIVESNGVLSAYSGGTVYKTVLKGGSLYLGSGASAVITQYEGGEIIADSQASVSFYDCVIRNGQLLTANPAHSHCYTTISSGGELYMYSGALISGAEVLYGGYLHLDEGVTASDISIASGGYLDVVDSLDLYNVSLEQGALFAGIINAGDEPLVLEKVVSGSLCGSLHDAVITGTLSLASDAAVSGLSGIYSLDLSRCSHDCSIVGNDFTQAQFIFGGDADVIDLSGNYWGTTDLDAIYAKLGVERSKVRIGDVLTVNPFSSVFAIKSTDLEKNHLNSNRDTIKVTFTGILDAATVSRETVILRNRVGKHLDIKDIQVNDSQIVLTLNEFDEEGIYTLEFSDAITDSMGQNLSSLRFNNLSQGIGDQLRFEVSFSGPMVLMAVPSGDIAGTINVFQVYFNKAVASESLEGNVWLVASDGTTVSPTAIRMISDSIAEFVVEPQTVTGYYSIMVSENVTDCSGNKLNQNGTGMNGEADDDFTGVFNLTEIDLTIVNVEVDTALISGNQYVISWDVVNESGTALVGSWTDGVYLSTDAKWDIGDTLLATYTHFDGLQAGGVLSGEAKLDLIGVKTGTYYLLVRSDIYNDEDAGVAASIAAQKLVATSITVDVPQLSVGDKATGTIADSGSYACYRLRQNADEALQLELNSEIDSANLEFYVGYGYAPNREKYDAKVQRITDVLMTIDAGVVARDVYILVYAKSIPEAFDYTLSARRASASIDRISSSHSSDFETITLTITGKNLHSDMSAHLVAQDGTIIALENLQVSGSTKLTAVITAEAVPPGDYTLELNDGDTIVSCPQPVSLSQETGTGKIEYFVNAPSVVGRHMNHTLGLTITNTGTGVIDAPMVLFAPTQSHANGSETKGAILSLNYDTNAFWVSTMPAGYSDSLVFFVNGDLSGTIQPGESVSVPIYYTGWREDDWDFGDSHINWNVKVLYPNDSTVLQWKDIFANAGLSATEEEALTRTFSAEYGDTWGGFYKMVLENLRYLEEIDYSINMVDATAMLKFEAMQKTGVLQPFRTLVETQDLSLDGITLQRAFNIGQGVLQECGSLGYGWAFNWDATLSTTSNGDIQIVQGGMRRLYQPTATFNYQTVNGDGSVLKSNGAGYRLTEKDGSQWQFNSKGKLIYVIQSNGERISCLYDSNDRLNRLTNKGNFVSFIRDADTDLITCAQDNTGRKITYAYSEDGDLISVTDSENGIIASYEYYASIEHFLTKAVDNGGAVSNYVYDESRRLVSMTNANGTVTLGYGPAGEVTITCGEEKATLYYNSDGNIAKVVDNGSGKVYTFNYSSDGKFVSGSDSEGNALSEQFTFAGQPIDVCYDGLDFSNLDFNVSYDTAWNTNCYVVDGITYYKTDKVGNILHQNDTADEYYLVGYDEDNNLVSYEYLKDGITTTYTYAEDGSVSIVQDDPNQYFVVDGIKYYRKDMDGNTLGQHDSAGDSYTLGYDENGNCVFCSYTSDDESISFQYDQNGNIISTTDSDGTTNYTYDINGNVITATEPDGTVLFYDDNKRLTSFMDADGKLTTYTYDVNGNIASVNSDGTTVLYCYDNNGNLTDYTDANGNTYAYTYDADGRKNSITINGRTTSYTYDEYGYYSSITDANGDTRFYTHNADGLLLQFTDANSNVTVFSYDDNNALTRISYADGTYETYTYNADGQLIGWTGREGQTAAYTIDADGNYSNIVYSDGTEKVYTYNDKGYMLSANDISFTYNADGDLLSQCYTDGRSIQYVYDEEGNLLAYKDEMGHSVLYTYTDDGEYDILTDENGHLIVDYDYDADGYLEKVVHGNGTYTTYTYGVYGQETAIDHYLSDGTLASFVHYDYNNDGNIVSMVTENGAWVYTYDAKSQLVEAVFTDINGDVTQKNSYTYDAMGNRISSTENGVTTNYTYNELNQIVSANDFVYRYDANGNLLEDEERLYSWTIDNQVASETLKSSGQVWEYAYDAFGNRVSSRTNGITTTWTVDTNGDVIAEYVDGVWNRTYYQGNQLTGFVDKDGNSYYYNADALTSTLSVTNGAGSVVNSYTYDPFGKTLKCVEDVENDFTFIGSYGIMRNDSGTYFVRARNYDPETGRWISPDPIGLDGGENLYAYVNNSPLNNCDNTGLSVFALAIPFSYTWQISWWGFTLGLEVGVETNFSLIGVYFTLSGGIYAGYAERGASLGIPTLTVKPEQNAKLSDGCSGEITVYLQVMNFTAAASIDDEHMRSLSDILSTKSWTLTFSSGIEKLKPGKYVGKPPTKTRKKFERALKDAKKNGGVRIGVEGSFTYGKYMTLSGLLQANVISAAFRMAERDRNLVSLSAQKAFQSIRQLIPNIYKKILPVAVLAEQKEIINDVDAETRKATVILDASKSFDKEGFNVFDTLNGIKTYHWFVQQEDGQWFYVGSSSSPKFQYEQEDNTTVQYGVAVVDGDDCFNEAGTAIKVSNASMDINGDQEIDTVIYVSTTKVTVDSQHPIANAGKSQAYSFGNENDNTHCFTVSGFSSQAFGKNNEISAYVWSNGIKKPNNSLRKAPSSSELPTQDATQNIVVTRSKIAEDQYSYLWTCGEMILGKGEKIALTLSVTDRLGHQSDNTASVTLSISSDISTSTDPNDKSVSEGYGEAGFILAGSRLSFKVEFENDPEFATAPAQWVRVYDTLDAEKFDIDSFELQSFCIAGNFFEVGDGRDSFNDTVQLKIYDDTITATIAINLVTDEETGVTQLVADFMAIDPESGFMLQNLVTGLLPVNDAIGAGEGYINYTIDAKPGLAHGTELTNTAKIYFDFNDPIDTPTALNTVDSVNPVVSAFNASVDESSVTITVTGEDADSGIAGYNILYSLDETNFSSAGYTDSGTYVFEGNENTVFYFKVQAVDNVGNLSDWSEAKKVKTFGMYPEAPVVSADTESITNKDVTLTAVFSEDSVTREYSTDDETWLPYSEPVVLSRNGMVQFRGINKKGKASDITFYEITNIDKIPPEKPVAVADVTTPTNGNVIVTATFTDNVEVASSLYCIGENGEWFDYNYENGVTIKENATVYFKAFDMAGNESEVTIIVVDNIDRIPPVIELAGDNQTPLQASTLSASTEAGLDIFWSTDNETWTKYEGQLDITANGMYYFKATDAAGNEGTNFLAFENIIQAPVSDVAPLTQTWEKTDENSKYIVELSTSDGHAIQLVVDSNSLDSFQMPAGNYQIRVKPEGGEWTDLEPVVAAEETDKEPKLIMSNEDGNADVFFAKAVGTWESRYLAQHVGSTADIWDGTKEYATLYGKNKLADIIEGSTDANILLMTDDENGDSLFVDDIYSALPGSVKEQQARIAQIDEIRAGFGNDIVDMTSQQFEYIGEGLTIRGGEGNDTIWANKGDNFLFGDAGNDRIVGASGNDVIAGGIGNDRMHGGGGIDVFTFCDNWGADNVEQLETGTVTLWFASGDESNWNAETLTYTDGDNSVTVKGVTTEQVTLRFGDDGSDQFATLSGMGAFFDATTERIFEESGKGMLASL